MSKVNTLVVSNTPVVSQTKELIEVEMMDDINENKQLEIMLDKIYNVMQKKDLTVNYRSFKEKRASAISSQVRVYTKGEFVTEKTNQIINDNLISALHKVTTINGEEKIMYRVLLTAYEPVKIIDPFDSETTGTIIRNDVFNAEYRSDDRQGDVYRIIFDYQDVAHILAEGKIRGIVHLPSMLTALAHNMVVSEFSSAEIRDITNKLVRGKYLPEQNRFKEEVKKAKWKEKHLNQDIDESEIMALLLLDGYGYLNGTNTFIDLNSKSYKTVTVANLKLQYMNRKISMEREDGEYARSMNPVDLYLQSKHRREFDKVVFDPTGNNENNIYNRFTGYSIKAIKNPALIKKFKKFVKEIICDNSERDFNIVWSFFAQIFQKPYIKMGTALILLSGEGSGKSTLMRVIGKLMQEYYMSSTDHKRIISPFNQHLEHVILFYANEAKFTDKSLTVNGLKNIITEIDGTTEVKNGDTYAVKNYTHIVIDGNDGVPVEQTESSRRFINVYVNELRIGDSEYWNELNTEIDTEGFYSALMYELMNFDYSEHEHYLRVPPKVEISVEQIEENFTAVEAWWKSCLVNGVIPYVHYNVEGDESLNILNEEMFQSFKKWTSSNNYRHKLNNSTFGKVFRQEALCGDKTLDKESKLTVGKARRHSHKYAKIKKCRKVFFKCKGINNLKINAKEWQLPDVG